MASNEETADTNGAKGGSTDIDRREDEGLISIDAKWFEIGFYLLFLVWLLYMIWEVTRYEAIEDFLFPIVVGVPGMILILLKIMMIMKADSIERILPDEEDDSGMFEDSTATSNRDSKAEKEKYELLMIGWIILLPVLMYVIGMGWALILYSFGFTWFFTRNIRISVIVTIVVIVSVWILFIEVLSLIIWTGLLDITGPLEIISNL
jgi:hypothetical protein